MEEKKKGKTRKGLIVLLIVLILAVCAAVFGYLQFQKGIKAVSEESQERIVTIESGSGYYQIIEALDQAGLIKNKTMAKLYVRFFGPDNPKANTYVLNQNMDLEKLLSIISSGDFQYLLKTKFTIIEGARIPEAAESIAKALGFEKSQVLKVWSDKEFLKTLIQDYWFLSDAVLDPQILYPLEGYLYPETYLITDQNPTIESVTRYCLDQMNETITPYQKRIEELGMSTHEFLSLASVVQAESLFPEDYKKIAGVFFNRLQKGMPLQSDCTVLYALQEKRVDVTYADLETESPYNTYRNTGVPIGPICAMQKDILEACADYEQHDYYYFFACEDGSVIYSKTLDEHNAAVKNNLWY